MEETITITVSKEVAATIASRVERYRQEAALSANKGTPWGDADASRFHLMAHEIDRTMSELGLDEFYKNSIAAETTAATKSTSIRIGHP